MKKILLGILIVAALSACSSSQEKMDVPMEINALNETVMMNASTLSEINSENEELRTQLEMSQKEATIMIEHMKMVKTFEGTGVTVTEVDEGLFLTLPGDTTFELGKAELNESMKTILDPIAESLMAYPETDIMIKGHTDISGTEEFNQTLSDDRAIVASDYLMNMGIDSTRIKTIGVGSSEPIDDNDTEDGMMANRRIDLMISY